jgi:hypothetical protein
MAVITPSALVSEISGSIGDQTYSRNRYGAYVKQKLVQPASSTPAQEVFRDALANAMLLWQTQSQAARNAWNEYVRTYRKSKSISRQVYLSGMNEFVSRYLNRAGVNSANALQNEFQGEPPNPWITAVAYDTGEINVSYECIADLEDHFLVFMATPPLSSGINSLNPSLLRIIKVIETTGTSGTENIFDEYDALFSISGSNVGDRIFLSVKAVRGDNFISSKKAMYSSFIGNIGFDADYQAVLDYADSQGWTKPSDAQQILQNSMVLAMKAAGIWSELDVYYVPANNGSENFGKINWKDPGTYTLVPTNSPTWTSDQGFKTTSSPKFVDTQFAPDDGVNYTQDDCSVCYWSDTDSGGSVKVDFGTRDNSSGSIPRTTYFNPEVTSTSPRLVLNQNQVPAYDGPNIGTINSKGCHMVQRTSSTQIRIFRNGTEVANSNAQTSNGLSAQPFYIGCFNQNGTSNLHSDRYISVWAAGASLSGMEQDFSDIITAYMNG